MAGIGGDGDARIRWDPPASDGGSAVTTYEVTSSPGGATTTTDGSATTATLTGLTNGTEYTIRVRARNGIGWGPWSTPSNVLLPRDSCTVASFADVPTDHPFCPEIRWMADEGISTGYVDGTYRPAAPVTRQAMAAFLYRLAGSPRGPSPTCTAAPFADVRVGQPFCGEIEWAVDAGVTTGYADGGFHPAAPVTRQAMAAFLYRLIGAPRGTDPTCTTDIFPDIGTAHPFCGEIDWMADAGITGGYADGTFRPTAAIARQSMAAFVFRYGILAAQS